MRCDSLGVDHSYDSKFKDNNWLEDIPELVADQHKPMLADTNGDLYRENISRMHQIAQVCKSKGITLYLVMPPRTSHLFPTNESGAANFDSQRHYRSYQ